MSAHGIIYEYILVAPPRYLRVAVTSTDSDMASAERGILTPGLLQCHLGFVPCVVLQTCRQIDREVYHMFYTRNSEGITEEGHILPQMPQV